MKKDIQENNKLEALEYIYNKACSGTTMLDGLAGPETIKRDLNRLKEYKESIEKEIKELDQYKEELGIDLLILFKALKNGFYARDCVSTNSIGFIRAGDLFLELRLDLDCICALDTNERYYFNDYGYLWALTKEELVNNNKEQITTIGEYNKESKKRNKKTIDEMISDCENELIELEAAIKEKQANDYIKGEIVVLYRILKDLKKWKGYDK